MNVFVCMLAFVIRLANRIFPAWYHMVICSLSGSTIFLQIIS